MELQPTSLEIWGKKYQLRDEHERPVDKNIEDTDRRVAKALASVEKQPEAWEERFLWAIEHGATPAGRIMSNAGAEEYKPSTSLINCTVSQIVEDSMIGILDANTQSGLTLSAGCGIGYEFSTLRPRGAFVSGAAAYTSGPLSFMDIFDSMCFTISSAGGRRGAQMGTFAVWHPDVEAFIAAKREDGRLRQFNLSLLIDDDFMEAVKSNNDYHLVFPVKQSELDRDIVKGELIKKKRFWESDYCARMGYIVDEDDMILCQVYKTIPAHDLWHTIMMSTYDYAEPGFLLIDRINQENNNRFNEEIRATNPCVSGDSMVEVVIDGKETTVDMKTLNDIWNNQTEDILVKSMNTSTKEVEYKKVLSSLMTRKSAEVLEITDDDTNKTLICTPDHKVWTETRGYVEARNLKEDDVLNIQ